MLFRSTASGFSGDGGAATSAKFNSLSYTFPDSSGNLYIADVNNDRIRVISVPISAISGLSTVCVGSTITFTDATSGGIWSSANTSIATVGSSSGIVNGLSAGVDTIYYTTIGGTASTTITVNPLPAPITGYFSICSVVGGTTTLSDATPGGTWSSSNPTIATIGSATGIANAVGSGPGTTTTITYTLPTGCVATTTLNVVPPPSPIFFGPNNVCAGACITMTPTVGGGTWSSTSGTVANVGSSTGVVCGLSSGTTVISYCCTCPWGKTVTVNPNPAPIAGPNTVCTGATIALSDLTPGGTWSASNGHATVGSLSGIVTGVTAGIDTFGLYPIACAKATIFFLSGACTNSDSLS